MEITPCQPQKIMAIAFPADTTVFALSKANSPVKFMVLTVPRAEAFTREYIFRRRLRNDVETPTPTQRNFYDFQEYTIYRL